MGQSCEGLELSLTQKGTVRQTMSNCVKALQSDQRTKGMFRYNMFTNKIEVLNAWWKRSSIALSDVDIDNICLYLDDQYSLTTEKGITKAINVLAHQNEYHPVRELLDNLVWDGEKRIKELFPRYLGADRSEYIEEATKLFMLGAINRVYKPGAKFDLMICIVEPIQGGGKSSLARILAINDMWFTDDIRSLDDKEISGKLQGHWIVEFSEMLATSNTKTVEAIKSFLSRTIDTYRTPYDRYTQDIPRQCVFIGTTNNTDFLPNDRTGNRRFIPIAINRKAAERHPLKDENETRVFVLQCWAEAMDIYRKDDYKLMIPEWMQQELVKVQQEYAPEDPKVGIIQNWLDRCNYTHVCTRMIFKEAFSENYFREPAGWELREISQIMNNSINGWHKHPSSDRQLRFSKYGKQRAWDRDVHEDDGFHPIEEEADQLEFPFQSENS